MVQIAHKFFSHEAAGGILLGIATLFALILENSSLQWLYDSFLTIPVAIQFGAFEIKKALLLWVNDGLMAIFFLLVGLEIKREIIIGQLSCAKKLSLPIIAALGGVVAPALIYSYINWGDANAMKGWAIPAATDIAFALGIIILLGKRIPTSLKITLVAIAIIDDLIAILIIAIFYSEDLSLISLGIATVATIALALLNYKGVTKLTPYMVIGIILWACVLKSGVHATLAGVLIAFFIPIKDKTPEGKTPLIELEHDLHTWVTYAILPLFAFANAGVSLQGVSLDTLMHPITLGIAAGLFLGKPIGIMAFTAIGVATRLCKLPEGVNWTQYLGMSIVTGVGFTMSLFIGALAFDDIENQQAVRLGVLLGSLVSGAIGYWLLKSTIKDKVVTA